MKTETTPHSSAVIACPSTWAFLPLKEELAKTSAKNDLRVEDVITIKAHMQKNEIDLAPCPSTCLFSNPNFELALPMGLSTKGSMHDAYIGFNESTFDLPLRISERIQQIKDIFYDTNIAGSSNLKMTTDLIWKRVAALPKIADIKDPPKLRFLNAGSPQIALARLFYRLIWGEESCSTNDMYNTGMGSALNGYIGERLDLLSGNQGLLKKCNYPKVFDLGELWYELTGLPFVSSVWQKLKSNTTTIPKNRISQACELAQARMKVEPTSYYPEIMPQCTHEDEIDLGAYWKNISYKLGSNEIRGLLFFLQMIHPLEKQTHDESFTVKMIRWQERENENQSKP